MIVAQRTSYNLLPALWTQALRKSMALFENDVNEQGASSGYWASGMTLVKARRNALAEPELVS